MPPISLEERADRIPQLAGRRTLYSEVPAAAVQARLANAVFVGSGSFCRVWRLDSWTWSPSPARGRPVVIKVCSAGFKEDLNEEQRLAKQLTLTRHWRREVNAHLLLHGQARVVRVYHTFCGEMLVPPSRGQLLQQPRIMQVVGLIEEFCNETSLANFSHKVLRSRELPRASLPLEHVASECAALMVQVGHMQRLGLNHQDIKADNIMVHVDPAPGSLPLLKFGDLNGAQWEALTRHGRSWIGTIGFMPRRVRKLYLGLQGAARDVGELNYDTYQMGKVLLRLLLEVNGTPVEYCRRDDDLEKEEADLKGAAIQLLHMPAPAGEPDKELWSFGVLAGLLMSWDEEYGSAEDQLRLEPAEAAEVLGDWGGLCAAWRAAGSAAFWESSIHVEAMARLYLRLAELAFLPPLDEPLDATVHAQADEWVVQCLDNFFICGTHPNERLGPVREKAAALLVERHAAKAAAAAAERQHLEEQQRKKEGGKSSLRSTAWEAKVAQRAEAEDAFFDGLTPEETGGAARKKQRRRTRENAAPAASNRVLRSSQKRKAGGGAGGAAAPAAAAAAKRPRQRGAAAAAGGAAGAGAGQGAAAGAGGNPLGAQGELLVLSSKLRLKDIWGDGAKPGADAPRVLGTGHAVAQMVADTVRAAAATTAAGPALGGAAAAGAAGEVRLQLGPDRVLRFGLTERRSVQFSRGEVLALAADAGACNRWNAFVDAALAAWAQRGKEGSRAERLRLLRPLLAARQ